ncbi:hypothetical protein PEC18_33950 [Paucibacter sp. O1-1]|uniref:hypothetical protein n=1 Tax=Paucibacter sp. M5-1 TaxID=3015998 RepID=UPI0010F8D29B|nr:hypothetical protein [Paucibacter sp. M5-1]MCU7375688.1 hypothetical protein [Paucibacter sp. O1-1]MCZ7883093.1 hypothetical protein [Paucibacter sp. M5-1]MDA3830696.1 hypothetical protein [Paucibacter sp. O1-1]
MNKIVLTTAALLVAAGLAAAQTKEPDHLAHHPEGAASAPAVKSPATAATAAPTKPADMSARMSAMQDMHQKMMAAKTPGERQALMGEYMKAMQGGMGMMKEMAGKGSGAAGMPADPKARMEAMEQRMDMMQMMMEMMMDRMPAAPVRDGK